MVSYKNSDVIQYLRQYEMFSNSLKLVVNKEERDMIIKQLTKLEYKIIEVTNEEYEEEYNSLVNKECGLLDEEKKRLSMLIELINQRLTYVEKKCNDHYQLTGKSLDVMEVLGAKDLDSLENRVRIIDKYTKNVKTKDELENEIQSLSSKIDLASEKIKINDNLNVELESKFKELLLTALKGTGLYDLLDLKDEIEFAYYETEQSLTLAELNLESSKTSHLNVYEECQDMLNSIKEDYIEYKSKLSVLRLIEIYDNDVDSYEELLRKRKEVNELLKYIKDNEFLDMVIETVTKQYNTILMEQQDVNTYNDLMLEKDRKLGILKEIDEENNSDEFQEVLKVLIENERKRQEKILEEKRKLEEEERRKRLEIERKKQEEALRRQKIIEDARKKEMEKMTKQLLEQQQNSVLSNKKKNYSFETIKDNIKDSEDNDKNNSNILDILEKSENKDGVLVDIDSSLIKNKDDIEKELFDEFNNNDNRDEKINSEELFNNQILSEQEDEKENKLPSGSIDEYMKNFDENKVNDSNEFFGSDNIFPSIPL